MPLRITCAPLEQLPNGEINYTATWRINRSGVNLNSPNSQVYTSIIWGHIWTWHNSVTYKTTGWHHTYEQLGKKWPSILSLPRVINFKFPLQPRQILHHTVWSLMKDDHTSNSHYFTYIHFSLKSWENVSVPVQFRSDASIQAQTQ